MIMKWTRCPAVATAGLFIAFSGAIAQQQGAGSSANTSAQGGNTASGDVSTKKSGSGSQKSSADSKFVMEAAQGGLEEVQLGQVAVQKAQNDKVKQFGQRMVDDHSKANDELKSIASKNGMTLPTDLDAKHKAMVDRMSGMSAGAAFDRAYMQMMVKDHQKDVSEFQKEANSGSDNDIKGFAAKTLPILQDHLRMAQETQTAVRTNAGSGSGNSSSSHSGSNNSTGSATSGNANSSNANSGNK